MGSHRSGVVKDCVARTGNSADQHIVASGRRTGALSDVLEWLGRGDPVGFSIAPAFPGFVGAGSVGQWVGRLHEAGAIRVEETGSVLRVVAEMRLKTTQERAGLLTSCPRVVRCLRDQGCAHLLLPVPTPMALHARLMQKNLPSGARVVFIGPCSYKLLEAGEDPEGPDAVIPFEEFIGWLGSVDAGPADFDSPAPYESRLAPLAEGISGLEQVRRFVSSHPDPTGAIELLGCEGGCLAGPNPVSAGTLIDRQRQLLEYASSFSGQSPHFR